VLPCVLLHGAKAVLEVGDGRGYSSLRLVHVLRKAPGGGSVERGDADGDVWRVLGVGVSMVHMPLRVAQVVCAGGVGVAADAVDGMRCVVDDALVRDVERRKQFQRCVSVCSDGSRPEAGTAGGGCLRISLGAL
jgi:hypothetical protein